MNKSKLKSYAPQARKDFIAAVTARAHLLGLAEQDGKLEVAPAQTQGDVTLIAGQPWPAKVNAQRNQLIARMRQHGFAATVEAIAYTWFNRFAALRYMEIHDYLGHGHRALSSSAASPGALPDLLTQATGLAQNGSLPGLNASQVLELKLAGNRDGELYRILLVAQCNALSRAMPFLFERIDDDSELLLPDNLLRSDSVIAKLVEEIPEEDWNEVEIIGWLYQFYISEKKEQVIGKVVKSEDIPAATQLFTPNWIVQYLVQNSVGRLWLMANPQSTLAKDWPYYIAPAEQTPEVQAQLDTLIQTRVREDGDTLNPESITVLDPACGSGHILVVAYDVLKAIYLERGYQPRAIPRLILEKNLYGLDIDDRAAQMAGFALLMKARADDRRLFTATDDADNLQAPKLNVLSLQESKGLNVDELATHLAPFKVQRATITTLVKTFEYAKTFGSLIQIPYALKTQLAVLPEALASVKQGGDMYATAAADDLLPLVQQAQVLAMQFDAVVANPPYMGGKGMNPTLKDYANSTFPDGKADLFAMFIERGFEWCKPTGLNSMVTMQSWMFLSSYEAMRVSLLNKRTLDCLIQLPYDGKSPTAMGINFGVSAAVFWREKIVLAKSYFDCFRYFELNDSGIPQKFPSLNERNLLANPDDFEKIPGNPFAYWATEYAINNFSKYPSIDDIATPRQGMATGDNDRFIRLWFEVSVKVTGFSHPNKESAWESKNRWFPFNKGGPYRKWHGNNDYVVSFDRDSYAALKNMGNHCPSEHLYFLPGVTWTAISSKTLSVRLDDAGFIFSNAGMKVFAKNEVDQDNILLDLLGLLNSPVAVKLAGYLSETFNFDQGVIARLPLAKIEGVHSIVEKLIEISRADWDDKETSWNFNQSSWVKNITDQKLISSTWEKLKNDSEVRRSEMASLEEQNNTLLINAYGLQSELPPEVPAEQITLARADREKDCQHLISYAIGCMMGRYSLDEPGLIYAHAGNVGFEPDRYATFPADADGIVPITDELWFADDAPSRIREFLRAVWGPDTLEENMEWLAESLGTKASETPDEAIRRYIADKFFKDHLQTYKKRPIYWLFSSGKQGAFQALVYLHRYHEGTLARLRAEYVVPLTGKIQSRIEMLQKDAAAASSTTARNKLNKEIEKLTKKHAELLAYDEKLRHYADMRIKLDLDDGVKVNYGKFGDLLEGVKIVTGGSSDD